MKFLTYIIAITSLIFGMTTTHAATIAESSPVMTAPGGVVYATIDRAGETITVDLKADQMQRAVILLRNSRGEVFYENIAIVQPQVLSIDIDTTPFPSGIYLLTVKSKDLKYQGRFKTR